ncbi:RNA polymerase sigma factor [Cytobacillus solani]|uniref:RNA polymerase sigma factor n=1 Tax=Cytobacillus solani TaxID=1637975 RepID=A0A0Q3QTH1_9BACI|nr:sigma-70 family RNA polymerase sigma factor [Cytobacillus solani]KOP84089.1 RNA polymerase subunit sigma-70 [Bacillus sp. FJAT-21945]KQL21022.1 RNA polymerase subunit sigma-70 [Cytobacillus solani]USK54270.1 sigma-70 family RNA polymerase sigma factor [Cytobacillus solani]
MEKISVDTFEKLYQEYSDKIFSYIYLLVNDREVAEDLTQDTFIKAYRNLDQFNGKSHLFTWLFRISRNVTIDYLRKKRLLTFFSIEKYQFESNQQTPLEIVMKGERITILYEAIRHLKLSYQEVLILRKIKEFSIKETAEILNWNENRVKITTSRAIAALKKELIKRRENNEEVI